MRYDVKFAKGASLRWASFRFGYLTVEDFWCGHFSRILDITVRFKTFALGAMVGPGNWAAALMPGPQYDLIGTVGDLQNAQHRRQFYMLENQNKDYF